eukprot:scaffold2631_cov373-Pavlova_lutheri.AAC.10
MASCSPIRKLLRRSTTPSYHVSLHASPCASWAHSLANSAGGIRTRSNHRIGRPIPPLLPPLRHA